MKTNAAVVAVAVSILCGCSEKPTEVQMAPLDVGTKSPDFEVVSPTELKLASGVKLQKLQGANGQDGGFTLMRSNGGPGGGLGGFMACGCVGATTSSCKTDDDNPEHPSCSGSCTDSEGNGHPCEISGPIIGPPRSPYIFRFINKR
jgi:hypothetical protein